MIWSDTPVPQNKIEKKAEGSQRKKRNQAGKQKESLSDQKIVYVTPSDKAKQQSCMFVHIPFLCNGCARAGAGDSRKKQS